jgi:hypothetical protein
MSTLNFTRLILQCDGCKKRHGDPHGHNSAQEARIAAYVDGWRFPATVRANGAPGTAASDVCPDCTPAWEPQQYGQRFASSTRLSVSEAPRPEGEATA